jgi:hypothetical protein
MMRGRIGDCFLRIIKFLKFWIFLVLFDMFLFEVVFLLLEIMFLEEWVCKFCCFLLGVMFDGKEV